MAAHPLTSNEAAPVVSRLGGDEKLRDDALRRGQDLTVLSRYLEEMAYTDEGKWVAFWNGKLVAAGRSVDEVVRRLEDQHINPRRAVVYCRVPPSIRVLLRIARRWSSDDL